MIVQINSILDPSESAESRHSSDRIKEVSASSRASQLRLLRFKDLVDNLLERALRFKIQES